MDTLIEALKQLSIVLGVVAPALKKIPLWSPRSVDFELRYERLKRFFHEGGEDLPPLQMEAAIASVFGHSKLSSREILFLLQQREPARFLERYLELQQYLQPSHDAKHLELKSTAAKKIWRDVVRFLATLFYVVFAGSAGWLLLFGVPTLVEQSLWLRAAGALFLTIPFAFAAWLSLVEARRISWAIQMQRQQGAA